MADVLINENTMTNIADAIRNKSGKVNKMLPNEMPSEISKLPEGAELNIHYGAEAPADTNKLWIKTNKKIAKTISQSDSSSLNLSLNNVASVLPTPRNFCCSATLNENIYVFGGYNNSTLNTIVKFKKDETVEVLPIALSPAVHSACCATVNNKIYIFGGTSSNIIYKFEIINNVETLTPLSVSLPAKIQNACCSAVGDNVYIFGGYAGSAINSILKFNTTNETIETLSAVLPTASYSACCSTANDKIYIFGGNASQKSIFEFNTNDDSIKTLDIVLPQNLLGGSCESFGNYIYIFGGENSFVLQFNASSQVLSTLSIEWKNPTSYMCCSILNNVIYIFGGQVNSSYEIVNSIRKFAILIPLNLNNVLLSQTNGKETFKIFNSNSVSIGLSLAQCYIGNSNNEADIADAYVYKKDTWKKI